MNGNMFEKQGINKDINRDKKQKQNEHNQNMILFLEKLE